ncbi:MAG: hypothetical protein ACJ790_20415 [Myxococcaceae bacterium]
MSLRARSLFVGILLTGFCRCSSPPSVSGAPDGSAEVDSGTTFDAGLPPDDSGVTVDAGLPADGGAGCGVTLPCELTLGVCAGAVRKCVSGAPEPVCTALSYGPNYSSEDVLCDGLDNDCDGRIDVGSPHLLFNVPDFNYLQRWYGPRLLRTDGGFLGVGSDESTTVLLDRAGNLTSSEAAARDAGWTSPPPILAVDPDGFRVLRVSGAIGYTIHYGRDGAPERESDGGVFRRDVGFNDAGNFWSPRSIAIGPAGDVLYVFASFTGQPHLEMWHRASDGGLIAGPVLPHAYSYGGESIAMPDGGFGLLDYATTGAQYTVCLNTCSDDLSVG